MKSLVKLVKAAAGTSYIALIGAASLVAGCADYRSPQYTACYLLASGRVICQVFPPPPIPPRPPIAENPQPDLLPRGRPTPELPDDDRPPRPAAPRDTPPAQEPSESAPSLWQQWFGSDAKAAEQKPPSVTHNRPPEAAAEPHAVDPSCGWWRLCNLWSGS